eukprot:1193190-Prorocentrum_minimum.AAC.1
MGGFGGTSRRERLALGFHPLCRLTIRLTDPSSAKDGIRYRALPRPRLEVGLCRGLTVLNRAGP